MDKILSCLKVYILVPLVYVITLVLFFPLAIITTIFVAITGLTLFPFIPLGIPIAAVFLFVYRYLADDTSAEAAWKDEKRFRLTKQCELVLVKGDITKWHVDGRTDAIVIHPCPFERIEDPLHEDFHPAARKEFLLMHAISKIIPGGKVETRPARTRSLPVAHIIASAGLGQEFRKGNDDNTKLLMKYYMFSCGDAIRAGFQYVAFPPISRGENRFWATKAAKVALKSLIAGQRPGNLDLKEVHFVFGPEELDYYDSWLREASRLELEAVK